MKMKNTLQSQLEKLNSTAMPELKKYFAELFGFECGQTNIHNLRKRLAYKLQENVYGGLSEEDLSKINELADADPLANLKNVPAAAHKIAVGTRIQRNWKGKVCEVTVLEGGMYEFEGDKYRSLSAIASRITGTHWNGKKFFGVN